MVQEQRRLFLNLCIQIKVRNPEYRNLVFTSYEVKTIRPKYINRETKSSTRFYTGDRSLLQCLLDADYLHELLSIPVLHL